MCLISYTYKAETIVNIPKGTLRDCMLSRWNVKTYFDSLDCCSHETYKS